MTIPWTGFPLAKLIERCKPLSKATHVKFISVERPKQMPGLKSSPWYPWPYYEGLRMDEAMNELAFVATGMYGEPLTKQNGSPLRLALPWKYGYKGGKAIVKLEFVDKETRHFLERFTACRISLHFECKPECATPTLEPGHRALDCASRQCTEGAHPIV